MTKEEQKIVQESFKVLDDINSSDEERELARLRMKKVLDYASDMEGSKKEGRKEGRIEGKIEEKIVIAKALLKEGVSIDIITNCTKLTKEEIESLKESI